MAEPILLELPPRDPRAELIARLEQAPVDHAEALLAGYELLQGLHESGLLEIATGVLGARDTVLLEAVNSVNSPGSVRGIRNLIILAKIAEGIEPEMLEMLAGAIPKVIDAVMITQAAEPPSIIQSLKMATGKNVRRCLAVVDAALGALYNRKAV